MSAFWNRRWDSQADRACTGDGSGPRPIEPAQPGGEPSAEVDGDQQATDEVGGSELDSPEEPWNDEDTSVVNGNHPEAFPAEDLRSDDDWEQPAPTPAPWAGTSARDFSSGTSRPLGWNGRPRGRSLVKPDEVRQAFSPHKRLLIPDTWQRSGLPAGGLPAPGAVEAHVKFVEEALRRTGAGRAGRATSGREDPQQAVGVDQAHDRDAQTGARRVGLPADPR